MGYMKDLAQRAADLWPAFAAEHAGGPEAAPTVRQRFDKGVALYVGGGVMERDASGAYKMRCQEPQKTKPGESTTYWTRLAGHDSSCDCADFTFRQRMCKHLICVWLTQHLGAAPTPWRTAVAA